MKKYIKNLAVLLIGAGFFIPNMVYAAQKAPKNQKAVEATTRNDAVIFKIHDITPVSTEGVVTGCDFTVTLYNRTAINFRSFTINLDWKDTVEDRFKFDSYVKSILGDDKMAEQEQLLGEAAVSKPLKTALTVNAFGAGKQVSVKSHLDNEKCYLLLSNASYNVSPCDIARNINAEQGSSTGFEGKDCTPLFQYVSTSNPEYFGKFNSISATEIAAENQRLQNRELSDIDVIISQIVDNLGVSDQTLTNIN